MVEEVKGAVMALGADERDALASFAERLRSQLSDPRLEVRLFGSKARGDDGPESDIDVIIIESSGDWRIADTVYRIATDILLETGVSLSTKVVGRAHYEGLVDQGSPFALRVMREGVAA